MRSQIIAAKKRIDILQGMLKRYEGYGPVQDMITRERKRVVYDQLADYQEKYGTLDSGENKVRDDALPKSTDGKNKVSLTARTVKGAAAKKAPSKSDKTTAKTRKSPDGKTYKNVEFVGRVKKWGEKQQAEVALMDFVARELAGGVKVHVYESYLSVNGNRYYIDNAGKRQRAPNGKYDPATGNVYVDLAAGDNGEGLVLNTFAHELYHHLEKWSPVKARQLAQFMVKEMRLDSVETMVEKQIEKAKANGHGVEYFMKKGMSETAAENIVRKRAFSDFVADCLETVFTQGNAMEILQRLRKSDKGLFNRIKNFVNKWVQRLREFYKENPTISLEGHTASQLKTFERIQKMCMEALVDAGESYKGTTEKTAGEVELSEDIETVYSLRKIVGTSGKNYGVGVYLDSILLSDLTEDERVNMIKEYVKELGGSVFTAYDSNRNKVDIMLVESGKKFRNKSGKRVPVTKDLTNYLRNEVKQEAIALIDELVLASIYEGTEPASHPHGWVDNNGKNDWDVWTTYIQDKKSTVWEAKLRIANSVNGEKLLYDIYPIKMVEGARTLATTTTNDKIPQPTTEVKKNSIDQDAENFSDRNTPLSNRALLAEAPESAVQTDWEKKLLQRYKDKLAEIETEEGNLQHIKQLLKELSSDVKYTSKVKTLKVDKLHAEKRLLCIQAFWQEW